MSDKENKSNDIDSSSFANILAGVAKMRESAGGAPVSTVEEIVVQDPVPSSSTTTRVQETASHVSPPPTTTARPEREMSRDTSYQKATLHKPMAKAVTRAENEALSRATKPQARVIGPSEVLVSPTQKGNILLSNSKMKTTAWRFDKSVLCDYYINPTFQILFLSLKLHKLRPEYIDFRWQKFNKGSTINTTKKDNTLRVLLVVVDIEAHQEPLRYLSDFCIKHDLSLVLAWSFEEAGNYIALSKEIDDTPAKAKKSVQGTRGADYNTSVVEAFTGIKSVNKTDVSNLLANCKSVKEIILQSCKEDNDDGVGLANIPGLGATKLTNLKQVFSEPFITNKDYNK